MAPEWNEAHFKCAHCGRHLSQHGKTVDEAPLPKPWRRFQIASEVGEHIACSDDCEAGIRAIRAAAKARLSRP